MTDIYLGKTVQRTNSPSADDTYRSVYTSRMGDISTNDINSRYMRWLLAGQVWQVASGGATPTFGGLSTIEINAAIDLTEPFFRFTVPASIVCVPIMFTLNYDTAPAALDKIQMYTSDTDTYSAGGVAMTALNMYINNTGTEDFTSSALTKIYDGDSALTEAALTNPRMLWEKQVVATGSEPNFEYNVLKGDTPIMVRGLASVCFAAKVAGAEEVDFRFVWAELNKDEMSNA